MSKKIPFDVASHVEVLLKAGAYSSGDTIHSERLSEVLDAFLDEEVAKNILKEIADFFNQYDGIKVKDVVNLIRWYTHII